MTIFKRGDFVTPNEPIYMTGIGTCYPGDIFVVAAVNRVDDTIVIEGDASDSSLRGSTVSTGKFSRANREFMPGDILTCMVGGYAGLSGGCLYTVEHGDRPDGDILHLTVGSNMTESSTLKCAATRFFYRQSNNLNNINDCVAVEVADALGDINESSVDPGPVILVEVTSTHEDGCFPRVINTQSVDAAILEERYSTQGEVPATGNNMAFKYKSPDHGSYEMRTYTSTEPLYWMISIKVKKSGGKITGGELLYAYLVRNQEPVSVEYDDKGNMVTMEYIPFEGSV